MPQLPTTAAAVAIVVIVERLVTVVVVIVAIVRRNVSLRTRRDILNHLRLLNDDFFLNRDGYHLLTRLFHDHCLWLLNVLGHCFGDVMWVVTVVSSESGRTGAKG